MDESARLLNLNVGVLGHVDSGKTSLVKALSTHLSTAALDKHPQSQQRGITLDLGFSAFVLEMPDHLKSQMATDDEYTHLQFTLVDCPGHASLIRTIIGGAQIIDLMVLVVDAVKGMQMQTGECLVVGELTTDRLVVALNKTDLLPPGAEREPALARAVARVQRALRGTRFAGCPVVPLAAAAGGEKVAAVGKTKGKGAGKGPSTTAEPQGVDRLVGVLLGAARLPDRGLGGPAAAAAADPGPALLAVDHCFAVKGQGTVLTGTMLGGRLRRGDNLQLPHLGLERKVRSMQSFRRPVEQAHKGDRVGVCVAGLDPRLVERALACAPGTVPSLQRVLAAVRGVRHFRGALRSRGLVHLTLGHATVMAAATFFGARELAASAAFSSAASGATAAEGTAASSSLSRAAIDIPDVEFPWDQDFEYQEELVKGGKSKKGSGSAGGDCGQTTEEAEDMTSCPLQWCLLQLQTPVYCPLNSLVIGSKFDVPENFGCRIGFYGKILTEVTDSQESKIKLYTDKQKEGVVHKVLDSQEVIGKDMFGNSVANIHAFVGKKVYTELGEQGRVTGPFGGDTKFKVRFDAPVRTRPGKRLYLVVRKYFFDAAKRAHEGEYAPPAEVLARLALEEEELRERRAAQRRKKKKEKEDRRPRPSDGATGPAPARAEPPGTGDQDEGGEKAAAALEGCPPAQEASSAGLGDLPPVPAPPQQQAKNSTVHTSARKIGGGKDAKPEHHQRQQQQDDNNTKKGTSQQTSQQADGHGSPSQHSKILLHDASGAAASSSGSSSEQRKDADLSGTAAIQIENRASTDGGKSKEREGGRSAPVAPPPPPSSSCGGGGGRQGVVDKLKGDPLPGGGGHEVLVVAGLFAVEDDIRAAAGRAVRVAGAEGEGRVEGPFGKAGKCKVRFPGGAAVPVGARAWFA